VNDFSAKAKKEFTKRNGIKNTIRTIRKGLI
jgi:hypothetical protein